MSIELQNCLFEANLLFGQLQFESTDEINKECNRGFWCVVSSSPWHCRATDAYVGQLRSLVGAYETQALAEAKCAELNVDACEENYCWVVGPEEL